MFVFSVNPKKAVRYLIPAGVIAVAVSFFLFFNTKNDGSSVVSGNALSYRAGTKEERLGFISQFGWEVSEEPAEVREIVIPDAFDEVYENYNELQKKQELDLSLYCGKRVKRWTYTVTNYPGYTEGEDCVRINLLVFDGRVVGGDVSSVELDGFMHTFYKE